METFPTSLCLGSNIKLLTECTLNFKAALRVNTFINKRDGGIEFAQTVLNHAVYSKHVFHMCRDDKASWRLAHWWCVAACMLLVGFHCNMSPLHPNYVDRQCIMTRRTIHPSVTTYLNVTRAQVRLCNHVMHRWLLLQAHTCFAEKRWHRNILKSVRAGRLRLFYLL